MPILLAVSPLAAIRSAPTTTIWTLPSFMTWAAMLSQIRVTGMPRRWSSQAVSRAPWSSGRVSSAKTRTRYALLVGGEDDRQGRAVIGRGQAAGVAVGQDPLPRLDQGRAMPADRPAHGAVFLVDRVGPRRAADPAARGRRRRPSAPAAASIRSRAQNRFTAVGRLVRRCAVASRERPADGRRVVHALRPVPRSPPHRPPRRRSPAHPGPAAT